MCNDMTENEQERLEMMLGELKEYEGPYAFLERFEPELRRPRKKRTKPMTRHVTDMAIVIDGITHWAVIGRNRPTSLDSTFHALESLHDLTWDSCDIECDVATRDIVIHVRQKHVKAA